jgi:uncharacterized protein (DUF58 family)
MSKRPQALKAPSASNAIASPGFAERVLRGLEWTVLRRLDGLLHGDYETFFRGFGLDLAELREYQLDDDVRYMDWNVTARLATPYVRVYREDREVTVWFLMDMSGSTDFGSPVKKRSIGTQFAAVMARLLTRHGNRVGTILYGDHVDTVVAPGSGRRHTLHILHKMLCRPQLSEGTATDLSELLKAALPMLQRRSVIFLVSDFISAPGWTKPLAQLADRHEIVGVRLFEPLERHLPDLGMLTLRDAETGEQLFVDTHDRAFRDRFASGAERHERQLRSAFANTGIDVLELSTDDDLVDAILRFSDLRRQRKWLATGGKLSAHLRGRRDVFMA